MPKGTGEWCAVKGCTNYRRKTTNVSYHRFPKEPNLRTLWLIKAGRDEETVNPDTNSCTICSCHFTEEDFERDMKAELLKLKPQKNLKKGAIPSKNLPSRNTDEPSTSSGIKRRERMVAKAAKQIQEAVVTSLLEESSKPLSPPPVSETMDVDIHTTDSNSDTTELKNQIEFLKAQLAEKNSEVEHLKTVVNQAAEEQLKGVFTPNQLKILLKNQKRVHWADKEIANAFTLRYLSKSAYVFVKEELHYPLPGLSTLQRWARNISIQRGLLTGIIDIMKIWGRDLETKQKLTILFFDEMKVKEVIEYNQDAEQFIGPLSQAMVIMARGLLSPWKQPIYMDFDKKMSKELLLEIIDKLKEINFAVVGVVCDSAAGNRGFFNEMGITYENPSYIHQGTEICFFPDAPHLLKLIRNWFLDNGFLLKDGTQITKDVIAALIDLTSSELNVCHKLNEDHINCEGSARQKVKLAAQLFSHTTSSALIYYTDKLGFDKKLIEETSSFFKLINNWFDLMNVAHPNESVPSKWPYGKDKESQNKLLKQVYDTIIHMRCIGKHSLQVFQKAMLLSINSVQKLLTLVEKNYGTEYLLTSKLNQDALENLFSQIRNRGGPDDHPTPLNFLYRLRMIIMGKNLSIALPGANVSTSKDEEFVLSQILKKSSVEVTLPPEINETQPEQSSSTDTASSCTSSPIIPGSSRQSVQGSSLSQHHGETSQDALEYLAGWLAKKFSEKYPDLGISTYKIKAGDHNYDLPPWTVHLSHGGLKMPSAEFMENILTIEKIFLKLFKYDLPRTENILTYATKRIMARLQANSLPMEVVKAFVKQRLFIRMKYLNFTKNYTKKISKMQVKRKLRKIVR